MTWEIALGELVALSIPLTGGWILKSETVGWVAAQLWWWVQPINFDGCNFAEKAMGVGTTGWVVVSRHEQVSTELWGKDPGALNSKKFRQNWFWDQNEIASPWELVEQIMLDLSLKTWGCSCINLRLPENKPKESTLHSTTTHLGWLAAHFFTSLPCGLKRHTHIQPHTQPHTHTVLRWSACRDKDRHARNLTPKLLHRDYGQPGKTQIIIDCLRFSTNTLKKEAKSAHGNGILKIQNTSA